MSSNVILMFPQFGWRVGKSAILSIKHPMATFYSLLSMKKDQNLWKFSSNPQMKLYSQKQRIYKASNLNLVPFHFAKYQKFAWVQYCSCLLNITARGIGNSDLVTKVTKVPLQQVVPCSEFNWACSGPSQTTLS